MQVFANGKTAFLFFHGILCDTPKISRGKKFDHSTTLNIGEWYMSIFCLFVSLRLRPNRN